MPLIGLCYIVLYVDRLNIGIAALQMNDELGISATAFGFAAGVYFWSYTLCEPPTLVRADDDLLDLWDAPVRTPALTWGAR